ncbi:MAG: hypothetical protein V3T14_13995 [Myxococcota bacterium]
MSVSYLWLPMFPRFAERWALPRIAGEFTGRPIAQYWDDTKGIGVEFKRRVIPEFSGKVAWDVFVLFDAQATWADAGEHVLGWGSTVVGTEQQLFRLLQALAESP